MARRGFTGYRVFTLAAFSRRSCGCRIRRRPDYTSQKKMIDLDRLRFPSGVAVTTIIRSGSAGLAKQPRAWLPYQRHLETGHGLWSVGQPRIARA